METELGKAYVQIVPSALGISGMISGMLNGEASSAGDRAGQSLGASLISKLKGVVAGVSIGKIISDAVNAGGELEQNLGGTEAVFGDFASTIQNQAYDAYKNMGMSASDYMATANKMGALFQGSGLEQQKALDLTSAAMQRAADVASVMGLDTSAAMESIAGAAKGNFTMMDNLGVSMNAATIQAYALEKGINFDWQTADNAQKAEVAMQMFMDRTTQYAGNFARESAETFSGSLGAMKASWTNFLANLTTGGDAGAAFSALATSAVNFADNAIKMILNLVTGLITSLPDIVSCGLNGLLDLILNLVDGIIEVVMTIADKLPDIIVGIVDAIIGFSPKMVDAGVRLFTSLVAKLPEIISKLVAAIPKIITGIISAFTTNIPKIIASGVKLLSSLVQNLPDIIAKIISAIPEIISAIVGAVGDGIGQMVDVGGQLIEGLWQGIQNLSGWLWDQVSGWASGLWSDIKGFFGIASPSKLFAWAGEMLDAGLAGGISDNVGLVQKAMGEIEAETGRTFKSDFDMSMQASQRSLSASMQSGLTISNSQETTSILYDLLTAVKSLNFSGDVLLDGSALVGELVSRMDEALSNKRENDEFGGGQIVPALG